MRVHSHGVCGPAVQKRESLDALVAQLRSKLQWESEARSRAEDQIQQYKEEARPSHCVTV